MTKKCARCNSENTLRKSASAGFLTCESCGSKTESWNSSNFGSVGIHPLLAKRYEGKQTELGAKNETKSFVQTKVQSGVVSESSWPKISGYELTGLLGKGAMGSVYAAVHFKSQRKAAIKVLSPDLVNRDDLVARFQREVAALRSFRHKNVIAIFDSGHFDDTHFFSMEYIQGTTLRKVLKSGPLPPIIAVKYCRQILQALSAAHARSIIHRDLKPENIIVEADPDAVLTGDERVVLVDFGLAGILNEAQDPHPNLTHSRVTMGTVNYMAPEQHVDAKRVDARTDIYACGVILYECLTGDLPLGRFALPQEKGVPVPESVDKCLLNALARSPKERYPSAESFDNDLAVIQNEILVGGFEATSTIVNVRQSERISSLETIFPTKWMKSPPWLKRPVLVGSAAIFIVFALSAVFLVTRTPNEVMISENGISTVYGRTSFLAPLPEVNEVDGSVLAILVQKANDSAWETDSPVWSYHKSQIAYFANQGDNEHVRRNFSFGTSPVTLSNGKVMSFEGTLTINSTQSVDTEQVNAQKAREILGQESFLGAGGIFLVDKTNRRAIGMVVYLDGRCGMTIVHRDGLQIIESSLPKEQCQVQTKKPLDIKIVCNPKNDSCYGALGAKKLSAKKVDKFSNSTWYLSLGCKNINCLFDAEKVKGKS